MSEGEHERNDVWDTDHKYPNADVEWWTLVEDVPHNINGHTGWRCLECARDSGTMNAIESDGGDYWQNKQLGWQEACDVLMAGFQVAVADHFPNHRPFGCVTCPEAPELPVKPNPPVERRRFD